MCNNNFLSEVELEQVMQKAKDPIYKQSNLLHFGRAKTDIFKVSPNMGLILIYGNTRTGFVHINDRHNSFNNKPYWNKVIREGKEYYNLDNPSRFSIKSIPFYDYINIAEELYKKGNLNIKNNSNPEYIDLYEGEVDLGHIESSRYRLLLYKGTKVIHNLYPIENKFTPPQIINFRRGAPSMNHHLKSCVAFIKIPYLDHNNNTIYEVIFRLDEVTKTEKLFIQINSSTGEPIITKIVGERPISADHISTQRMMSYEFADMSFIEKIISNIHNRRSMK